MCWIGIPAAFAKPVKVGSVNQKWIAIYGQIVKRGSSPDGV